MSFWNKFKSGLKIARFVLPFVKFGGKQVPILNTALAAIDLAEDLGIGKGDEKKKLATLIALNSLRTIEALAGKELFDEVAVANSLGPLIDALVRYRNESNTWRK